MRIALSHCHNEKAQGAVNKRYGLTEYQQGGLVLEFLAEILTLKGHDVRVFEGNSLREKIAAINAWGADLAVEPHFNADADHLDPEDNDDSRGRGIMTMYCPQYGAYGIQESLAYKRKQQADAFSAAMYEHLETRNLGGRQGWWWGKTVAGKPVYRDGFLTKTNCPAFIPEPGYIDNARFAADWLVSGRQAEIAEALAAGIEAVL